MTSGVAPRPGDGDELRGLGSRDGEPHRRRHGVAGHGPAAQHRRAVDQRHAPAGPVQLRERRHVGRRDADHLHVPVGSVRRERRKRRRIQLHLHLGRDDVQLHPVERGRRTAASHPRDGDQQPRRPDRRVERVRGGPGGKHHDAAGTTQHVPALRSRARWRSARRSSRASAAGRGTSPIAYAYEWLRCGTDGGTSSGAGCTAIAGATTSQYTPSADRPRTAPPRPGDGAELARHGQRDLEPDRAGAEPGSRTDAAPDAGPRAPAGRRPATGREGLDPRHERLAAGAPDRRRDRLRAQHGALAPTADRAPCPGRRHARLRGAGRARLRALDAAPHHLVRRGAHRPRRLGTAPAARRMRTSRSTAGASSSGSGCASSRTAARGRLEPEARPGRNGAADRRALGASGRRAPARSLRERSLRYPWIDAMIGISRIATMFAILIIGLIAGPAVSL